MRDSSLAAFLCTLIVAACGRSTVQEPAPASTSLTTTTATATVSAPPTATLSSRISRSPAARVVAIGDLHGDLDAARRALRLAGAIDVHDAWIGGTLTLVQTGDEIDRADGDRAILDLFERLKVDATKAGGEVIALTGNHELMNASLDFRYVTPGGFAAFSDLHLPAAQASQIHLDDPNESGRAAAFLPGGPYALKIAERPLFVKVGDSVFVHGGILPKHLKYGLDRMNDETHDWLLGKRADCPKIVSSEDGPVWTRMYSAAPGREECATLDEALQGLNAKRMVVGHTVQRNGISSACSDHVWRIDTGMSKVFEGKIEVLEIRGDVVATLRESADGG
ncbi:MAG: metallophosphoesterase [Polyangiaceae bacterium]